ncbi:uncharacterized protein LOC119706260 [Motacilla alba alba]|uniref:uncharacterized protein LOC119706260 n=1 Tax=Motacilla alba alba TaxID=1094192 RepID=UPI0018D594CD|nr:uncharacterized protein LOC119706260 [Motacilla alba alba]
MPLEEVLAQMMPRKEMCPQPRDAQHGLPQALGAPPLVTAAPAGLLPAHTVGIHGCSWPWSSASAAAGWALLVLPPGHSCDNSISLLKHTMWAKPCPGRQGLPTFSPGRGAGPGGSGAEGLVVEGWVLGRPHDGAAATAGQTGAEVESWDKLSSSPCLRCSIPLLKMHRSTCEERRWLRPQQPVAHREPPAASLQGPELARLPSRAGAAGPAWPSWTAAPQGPGEQGTALGRVPGQERAPERLCLSRAISSLLFLLPALLCLCPVPLGLLLARQPQWEPALAAAPAGPSGQGPAIRRPMKAQGSSRTLSRVTWTPMDWPQLHSRLTGNVP